MIGMKKILKFSLGVLFGASAVLAAQTFYQNAQDEKRRNLLALAKEQLDLADVLVSWLVADPNLPHIYEGGVIDVAGNLVTFKFDAQGLEMVETKFDKIEREIEENDYT
jgi:hypothetical protein